MYFQTNIETGLNVEKAFVHVMKEIYLSDTYSD